MTTTNGAFLQQNALSLPSLNPVFNDPFLRKSGSPRLTFLRNKCLRNLRRFGLITFCRNPSIKAIRGLDSEDLQPEAGVFVESGASDSPVDICHTRTLPPALTLEHGLIQINEVVEGLKSDPPRCKSGILRFQVAVPPSTKALNWLCCQLESSGVFPQFYLSKAADNATFQLHPLDGVCGISGIGAAVYFTGSSFKSSNWGSIKRYLSIDSPGTKVYGFMGIDLENKLSSLQHDTDSFYIFIPQIELDEYENHTLLAATVAWNELSLCTLEKAVRGLELAVYQAIHNFSPSRETCYKRCVSSTLKKSGFMEDKNVHMVYMNALALISEDTGANNLQLEGALTSCQFYFRLSTTVAVTTNMVGQPSEINSALSDSANINAMWASLIIEECIRLGLTYFCIAPGSRSSPLTVAATAHNLASCISCFDERSLAFHAVGYARGSHKPAVVITSSGTAVSNLLPAVVEASQDFVPLLLLTADRPPELQDAGANQAINQVNHFGSFVRFFFSLPPPTDHIPARMVLTTIDSAVYSATHAPHGPVHINCPFREPLEDIPREWMLSCLNGLDSWMSRTEPFTKYIRMECCNACKSIQVQMAEILKVIQSANQGLLLIGAIHTEDEIWATLLLAKHLFWPVVPDILSGIRMRKLLTFFPAIEENFIFIDHLDHALVSELVRVWARPDVIVQIGSRITSKRIAHLLEFCSPSSYIMVEKHPYRHDPSHIITHRIQSTITEFANCLLKANFPKMARKWSVFLKALDVTVSRELSFHIHAECALTEPYVAQVISESFPGDTALFIGNSMAIRDMDMYGHGWVRPTNGIESTPQSFELLCHGIQATGNRGASGIDGLLSTAVGFAVGCNKRVVCVVGDVSFLHDTNGLAILNQRKWRKPMTIVVINNYGGAIFSLLPIADRTQPSILNQYFYTSHDVSIRELCVAHGVKHLRVRTKVELQEALYISQHAQTDIIIEVESNIEANAAFHRRLRKSACQAADHAMNILSALSIRDPVSNGFFLCRIHKMELSFYRIQLSAPPTSAPSSNDLARSHREGFILTLFLEDGNVGFGEVSPLEIHKENMEDVEEQLRFLVHAIQGARISFFVPLAEGSFSSWIWCQLGIRVLCGLEMAILNALAARQGSTLSDILLANNSAASDPQLLREKERSKMSSKVQICALLDSNGSAEEVAHAAARMAEEGFTTLKLKVARQANPIEDAAIVHEIRRKIGHHVKIRVDANRNWTYEQAIQFGYLVKGCNLEFIEEPVNYADDIIKFCEETGLPVALDESINNIQGNPLKGLSKFIHSGIIAVVIKPSVVGGFEKSTLIAKWAQMQDKLAIVSSAFESSLSLAAYIQFSHYLEKQNRELCILRNKGFPPPIAHGLGTYRWLEEDVSIESVRICLHPFNGTVEAAVEDAAELLKNFELNQKVIQRSYSNEQVQCYQWAVDCKDFSCSLKVREAGLGKTSMAGHSKLTQGIKIKNVQNNVFLFLHGFLGTGEDWIPIMKAISGSARCISVDLPGHGGSQMHRHVNQQETQELSMSMEVIADILNKLIHDIAPGKVILVGYSMGARIALYMALRRTDKVDGTVLVSGSPGLKNAAARSARTDQDDSRARLLTTLGLQSFLDSWYAGEFWKSLRGHSHFKQVTSNRSQHGDVSALAKVLSDLSIGRQPSLWEDLKQCRKQLLLVVGEKDQKFKEIARQMIKEMGGGSKGDGVYHELVEIPECGHAVHLENPLPLINAVRKFLTKLNHGIVQ